MDLVFMLAIRVLIGLVGGRLASSTWKRPHPFGDLGDYLIAVVLPIHPHQSADLRKRVKQVFLVTVQLADADGRLKPGMPADAAFQQP